MGEQNKVEVIIGGEIITLMSTENEAYMQKLALYIDKKISKIKAANSSASINDRTRTVFIAVNIADDYFKAHDKNVYLEAEMEKYTIELGAIQEENILLTDKMKELQYQLNQSRKELDDHIAGVDKEKQELQEQLGQALKELDDYIVETEKEKRMLQEQLDQTRKELDEYIEMIEEDKVVNINSKGIV